MYRLVASVWTVAFFASVAAGEDVFVLEKGRPVTIVLADSPTIAERTAAKELDAYLSKMTGVPCVTAAEAKAAKDAIYIGPTALAKQAGIDCTKLDKEEWILLVRDGNLIVAGGRPRGTLYGVYDLLERLGVTWPDVESESVPTLGRQAIAWNVRAKPAIMNRCIYNGVGQTFAYTFTLDAPKHIKPAGNVLIRVCKLGCEFFPSGKADTQFPVSHACEVGEDQGDDHVGAELMVAEMLLDHGLIGGEVLVQTGEVPVRRMNARAMVDRFDNRPAEAHHDLTAHPPIDGRLF